MAQKCLVTTISMRPLLRPWCQASRIRGCGMVLNSTGRNMFTMAGPARNDSSWSWTFRIVRVTWLRSGTTMSQKLECAIFFAVCLTIFQFEFWRRGFTIGFYWTKMIRSELMFLECSFPWQCFVLRTTACSRTPTLSALLCFYCFLSW